MRLRASVVGTLIFVFSIWVLVDSANEDGKDEGPLTRTPLRDTNEAVILEEAGTSEVRREEPDAQEHPQQRGHSTGASSIRGAIQRLDPRFLSLNGAARRIIASWMIAATECVLVQNYGQRTESVAPFYLHETAPGADAVRTLLREYIEKDNGKDPVRTNPLEAVLPLKGSIALYMNNGITYSVFIEEILSTQFLLYKVRVGNTPEHFALRAFSLPEDRRALKKLFQQEKTSANAYAQLMKFARPGVTHRTSHHFRANVPYAFGTLEGIPHKSLDLPNGITMLNFFLIEHLLPAPLSDFCLFLDKATVDPAMAEAARLSITIQLWMLIAHFTAERYHFASLKARDFAIDSRGVVFVKLQSGLHREGVTSRCCDDLTKRGEKKQLPDPKPASHRPRNSHALARIIVGVWCDGPWEDGSEDAEEETQLQALDLDLYDTCLPWEVKSLVEQLQNPSLTHTVYTHSVERLSVYARLVERLDFAESLAQIRAS